MTDNPKEAAGAKKVGLSVLPVRVLFRVALAFLEGALKYGRHNYREAGLRASTYFDANMRHMAAWYEGQDIDPHSPGNLHHVDKAIASLVALRDSMMHGNWIDDRPPRVEDGWIEEASEDACAIKDAVDQPVAPFTEKRRHQLTEEDRERMNTTSPLDGPARGLLAERALDARRSYMFIGGEIK